jgi:hypothetical protein
LQQRFLVVVIILVVRGRLQLFAGRVLFGALGNLHRGAVILGQQRGLRSQQHVPGGQFLQRRLRG